MFSESFLDHVGVAEETYLKERAVNRVVNFGNIIETWYLANEKKKKRFLWLLLLIDNINLMIEGQGIEKYRDLRYCHVL